MKIGPYSLYSIETSRFGLDGGAMFGIIPKVLWEKEAPADSRNRIEMVTRSLLLTSADHKILVDTGNGTKWQEKFKAIYSIDTDTVNLERSLGAFGVTCDEITDVVCTHLHFDHIGGNTRMEGDRIVPTFPNARYWMSQANWTLANSPNEKDQGSFMADDWKILEENGMIRLVSGAEPFLPEMDILVTNGHTMGQMHPLIRDEKNSLLYCGDLIPMSAHIPVPWIMAYDIQPLVTVQEKKRILPRMVAEDWILFFEHDPGITACKVSYDGRHYHRGNIVDINR